MADIQSDELVVVPALMDWLEGVRHVYEKPMVITSGYKTPLHQWELTGQRTGARVDGMKVDVLVSGTDAYPPGAHRLQPGRARDRLQLPAHRHRTTWP